MMEEVSDDTNGESSFEFVSGKIDESSTKDDNVPLSSSDQSFASTPVVSAGGVFSQIPGHSYPVAPKNLEPSITFYDPKDSASNVFPPLIPPSASPLVDTKVLSAAQNQYPPVPQSTSAVSASNFQIPPVPPQTFQVPPAQQPYVPPVQYSTLNLPLEPVDPISSEQHSEGGVWGWLKGKDFLNKVAEKAKSSVDSVITTLDPGMKEIINTGGDINVIVASGNEDKISAVREAFQLVFGKATVQGIAVQSSCIAPQPVGFSAGLKAAEERISNLKQMGLSQDGQIFLAIENFLTELTPDNWFDMGCLLLHDQSSGIMLQVYTEAIPISSQYVTQAKEQTPIDYPLGWSGYAVTIGQIMGPALGVHHSQWHQALTGVSRREILSIAAKTMAGLYRSQLGR